MNSVSAPHRLLLVTMAALLLLGRGVHTLHEFEHFELEQYGIHDPEETCAVCEILADTEQFTEFEPKLFLQGVPLLSNEVFLLHHSLPSHSSSTVAIARGPPVSSAT